MRIAFITPGNYNQPGGAQTRATRIANALAEEHSVTQYNIDAVRRKTIPAELKTDEIREVDTGVRHPKIPLPLRGLGTIAKATALSLRQDFDLVYVEQSFFHGPIIAWLCSRLTGVPLIISVSDQSGRSVVDANPLFSFINGPVRRRIIEAANVVVLESETLEEDLRGDGITPKAIRTVPTGIDLLAFGERYPQLTESNDPTVFYMGRSADLDLLLDAAPLVARQLPDVEFRLAGMEAEDLDRQIPDCVHVLGFLPEPELYQELARAQVCVSPYIKPESAGRPVKLLEYMAARKCIVATDRAFNTQMLTDQGNAIVTPADPESFAGGIVRALTDDSLRNRLGEQARTDVEAYSLETSRVKLAEAIELATQ